MHARQSADADVAAAQFERRLQFPAARSCPTYILEGKEKEVLLKQCPPVPKAFFGCRARHEQEERRQDFREPPSEQLHCLAVQMLLASPFTPTSTRIIAVT